MEPRAPDRTAPAIDDPATMLGRLVLESSLMMGVVEVEQGSIRHLADNTAAAAFFRRTPEELRGRRASELGVPPEIETAWCRRYEEALASGAPVRFDYHHAVPPDERWLAVTVSALPHPPGTPPRFSYIVEDVTERRRIEASLRQGEARYRGLVETQRDLIVRVDPEGRFTFVNDAYCTLFGRQRQELLGQRFMPLVHPDDREATAKAMEALEQWPYRIQVEQRAMTALGWRWLLWEDCALHDTDGRLLEIQAVGRDVTEFRRALDEQRNLADKLARTNLELEQASRLKDDFLANVSHELRTPLSAILGVAELLRDGRRGPLERAQIEAVATIESSGRHLLELINDILDLSKIAAGRMELERRPIAVATLCEASLELVRPLALSKRIHLDLDIDGSVEAIEGDPRRLREILVNLLGNGVKYTESGGLVGLAVHGDREHRQLRFVVWDTGIGITPSDKARLFQPFVQLDSSLTRRQHGTGLGLAMVARLAALHAGTVEVESSGVPGAGSRFTVTLPWDPELKADRSSRILPPVATATGAAPRAVHPTGNALDTPGAGSSPALPAGTRVLIAEDSRPNAEIFAEYLSAHGADVKIVGDGESALALAPQWQPQVIVMDVQMPGLDGLEVMRRMRADERTREIPILAVTALSMPGDRERCLEAGARRYLPKPLGLSDLLASIIAVLGPTPG